MDFVEWTNITIHREYTVSNDEFETAVSCCLKLFFKVFHVSVSITEALSFTKTYTIDDRCVVQCVRDDSIFCCQKWFEYTTISIETCCIEDSIFSAEEVCDSLFKVFMAILSTADETYRRHTIAAFVHSSFSSFDKSWVVSQTKVVICTEVQYLFACNSDFCTLWRTNQTFAFIKACFFNSIELGCEMLLKFVVHDN